MPIHCIFLLPMYMYILQNAELCGKTPGQKREPELLRLTGPLNNSISVSKGSL